MAYFCPTCGEPVKNKDAFCPSCGASLADGAIYAERKEDLIDLEDLQDHTQVHTSGNYQYEARTARDEIIEPEVVYEEKKSRTTYENRSGSYTQNNNYNYYSNTQNHYERFYPLKNKTIAGILAIVFGWCGAHKFYLGQTLQGVLMLLFCWTGIPAVIGFIQGIIYLVQSNEEFEIHNHVRTR